MDGFFYALFEKRRFIFAALFLFADVLLMSLLVSAAHASQVSHAPHNQTTTAAAVHVYDSPNVVTNAMEMMLDDVNQTVGTTDQKISNGVTSLALGVTHDSKVAGHGMYVGAMLPIHIAARTSVLTAHATVDSFVFVGHCIGDTFSFSGHVFGDSFKFAGRDIGDMFKMPGHVLGASVGFAGHAAGGAFRFAGSVTHVSSIIRAPDHKPVPTITQLRIEQAAIIQTGTQDVSIAPVASGSGGACDAGDGNGGYPMRWCNATMDSIATIAYSSDPINRECTSYAYWYFTKVEGHTGFRVWGNAKDWAASSNYPTYALPEIGAIAVETAGAYGHVAIVQALPGQKYDGETVPAGDVLVSEMNYDWNGHFRYSYSPLSKFSDYIY